MAFSKFWKAGINVAAVREEILGQNCPFTPAVKLTLVLIQSPVSQKNYSVVLCARGIIMFQNQFSNLQTEYRDPRFLPLSHKVRFLCWTAFYLLKVPAWLGSCWEPALMPLCHTEHHWKSGWFRIFLIPDHPVAGLIFIFFKPNLCFVILFLN